MRVGDVAGSICQARSNIEAGSTLGLIPWCAPGGARGECVTVYDELRVRTHCQAREEDAGPVSSCSCGVSREADAASVCKYTMNDQQGRHVRS
jgi:hypothetical protein